MLNCGKAETLGLSSDLLKPTSVSAESKLPEGSSGPHLEMGLQAGWVGEATQIDALGWRYCTETTGPPSWRGTQALEPKRCGRLACGGLWNWPRPHTVCGTS